MVWGFVGAIGTTIMIYILPPAFYLRVRIHPPRPDLKQIAAWGLMLTGLAVLIVGTYQSFANVINPIPKVVRPHGLSNSTLHGTVSTLLWIFNFEEPLKQNVDDWWTSYNTFLNTWRSYVTVYPSQKSVKNNNLQSISVFSIPCHPCFIMVYYYLFDVSLSNKLLFSCFLHFEGNFVHCQNKTKYCDWVPLSIAWSL